MIIYQNGAVFILSSFDEIEFKNLSILFFRFLCNFLFSEQIKEQVKTIDVELEGILVLRRRKKGQEFFLCIKGMQAEQIRWDRRN